MKAVIWTKYGGPDGLVFQEIEKPIPKDHEVLVKVHATTVTAGDCEMRALKFPIWLRLPIRLFVGLRKPKNVTIIGQEFSGEVEGVGKDVKRFKPGDQVFGTAGFMIGTYAEYLCLPEDSDEGVLAVKPANMTFEEAAAVPTGGMEALHFLRKAELQTGDTVLINGAGGSIGTAGIQLAKYYGVEVIAVDSAEKLDMLTAIGADHVIDYQKEDFTKNGQKYDVIFDVIGKSHFSRSIASLSEDGVYLIANPRLPKMIRGQWVSRRSNKQVVLEMTKQKAEDLIFLRDLIEAGKLIAVIDRTYSLKETAEAHEYVETGKKQGNVVVTLMK